MLKRILSAFFACCTAVGVLTACGSPAPQTQAQGAAVSSLAADGKVQIVTTIFPLYDWTRQILGEEVKQNADLQFLLGDGVDFHNYQATAKDILTVSQADLLVYVGGTSDAWIEQACEQNPNPNRVEINLMELLAGRLKTEELVEGMEHSHEDEDEHEHTSEEEAALHDEHDSDAVYDEHVWLSVKNAEIVCDALQKALSDLMPQHSQQIEENAAAYQAELSALDKQFRQAADSASTKTLMFADRFPFRYLTDDYGLSYYAAFTGCSTDTQASFETISFLSEKVSELSLQTILTIDDSNGKIAQTVAQNSRGTAPEILSMNSMQSITRAQAEEGVTYVSVMQDNLTVLRTALACA